MNAALIVATTTVTNAEEPQANERVELEEIVATGSDGSQRWQSDLVLSDSCEEAALQDSIISDREICPVAIAWRIT